jgi:hypothetical protein
MSFLPVVPEDHAAGLPSRVVLDAFEDLLG